MVKRRLLYYVLHLQRETETINAQNETEGFKSSRFINMWNVYAKKKMKLKIKKLFFFFKFNPRFFRYDSRKMLYIDYLKRMPSMIIASKNGG